ncbi:MAG: pyruvate formate lyase family protein, partial [Desulfobacterales bacterium]
MTPRIDRLRQESFQAQPFISAERAQIVTRFYRDNQGKYSTPVLRALNFKALCEQKSVYIGPEELIVGERGPFPKAVSTFPELTCHSLEDLKTLDSRPMTRYRVDAETLAVYETEVIPFWQGRSLRERVFADLPETWQRA